MKIKIQNIEVKMASISSNFKFKEKKKTEGLNSNKTGPIININNKAIYFDCNQMEDISKIYSYSIINYVQTEFKNISKQEMNNSPSLKK